MLKNIQLIFTQSFLLTRASLKARYRNSFAGYLWVILAPMTIFVTQAYVFKVIFKIEAKNYFVFLLFGLSPWLFFSQTLEMSSGLLYHQAKLLKSFKMSPITLLAAQAFDNLLNSLLVIFFALVTLSFFGDVDWAKIIFFPIPYISILISTLFLSFFIAVFQIFYFDTRFVTQFILGLLYFVSPIVYPENFVPEKFQFIIQLNPLTYLLRPFRTLLDEGLTNNFFIDQFIAFLISLIIASLAILFWRSKRYAFYLRL